MHNAKPKNNNSNNSSNSQHCIQNLEQIDINDTNPLKSELNRENEQTNYFSMNREFRLFPVLWCHDKVLAKIQLIDR